MNDEQLDDKNDNVKQMHVVVNRYFSQLALYSVLANGIAVASCLNALPNSWELNDQTLRDTLIMSMKWFLLGLMLSSISLALSSRIVVYIQYENYYKWNKYIKVLFFTIDNGSLLASGLSFFFGISVAYINLSAVTGSGFFPDHFFSWLNF